MFFTAKEVQEHLLNSFPDVEFDEETHSYTVKGEKIPMSVTQYLTKYKKETDFNKIARKLEVAQNLPIGSLKTYWDYNGKAASAIGTSSHYYASIRAFYPNFKPSSKYEIQVDKFFRDLPYYLTPIFTEFIVYDLKGRKIAGSIDLLLFNTITSGIVIADYKFTKDLFRNYKGQTLLGKYSNMLDTSFNKYRLQLNIYEQLLKQANVIVEDKVIVWITDEDYTLLNAKINKDEDIRLHKSIENFLFKWSNQ